MITLAPYAMAYLRESARLVLLGLGLGFGLTLPKGKPRPAPTPQDHGGAHD